MGKSLLRLS